MTDFLMCGYQPDGLCKPACNVSTLMAKRPGLNVSAVHRQIRSVTQSGYERDHNNTYRKRSLPPLEFKYSQAEIQEEIHVLDNESLRNLPEGLDGVRYQWVDFDGEGVQRCSNTDTLSGHVQLQYLTYTAAR